MLPALGGPDHRRSYLLAGLMLGGVALVGVSTGVLLGLAQSGAPAPARRAAPAQVAPPEPSPEPTATFPTELAQSDVEPGRRSDVGYFLAARHEEDGVHVTFDRVQLRASSVVNENPRTRELVLAPDVAVAGGLEPLLEALPVEGGRTLLEVAYDPLGYVIAIRAKSAP